MTRVIDCMLIGHNEMNFREYEKTLRKMGENSGPYRDLNLNFMQFNNKPYYVSEIYNLFSMSEDPSDSSFKPVGLGETFSAAIAYLGTYLDRRGFTFDYVNSFQEKKEELAECLKNNRILTVAIITTLYVSVFPILEIVEFIRRYNRSVTIIIGGPFISTRVRTQNSASLSYLFKSIGADVYVNSSQGESALVEIITHLKKNLSIETVNNIFFKTEDGYKKTGISREINRLSENMVNWRLFADKVDEFAAVRTAISCPYSCSFCGFPQHAGKYQIAGMTEIESELDQLDKIERLKCVHFVDDTFNVPRRRFREILRMMIRNRYKFQWHSYFRCQLADRETVELMKESGCEGVFLGLESGNQSILNNMNKGVTIEEYMRGIALLKEYDIVTFGDFIIGFPGETLDTEKDTRQFLKESGLDFFRAQMWYCEPITPIWREREKYQIKGESFEWSHATMDAGTAADLIDSIFLSIDQPVWIPQYNFDFDNLWHLVHRGLDIEQVKQFLRIFNQGVRQKLLDKSKREVSFEVVKQLKRFFRDDESASPSPDNRGEIPEKYGVSFNF